jgi:hypothetical protein
MREASRTIAVMILGALLGIAGFVTIDRWTRTTYAPPAFEQSSAEPEAFAERPTQTRPYRYCSEAQADDATPIFLGDPGYNPHLDGDGDGIACERW